MQFPRDSAEFLSGSRKCTLSHRLSTPAPQECAMKDSDRKIRVVVADDSRTALNAVCAYLEFEGLFEIVGTASDGLAVLHQAERPRPDLVLTDLSMPQITRREAAMQLRQSIPGILHLLFTGLDGASTPTASLQC